MRPPRFWFLPEPNWQAHLLAPLAWIWQWKTRKRLEKAGVCADLPVISVGNINLGGTGKTPTTIFLVQALQAAGLKPVVILRGYKGREKGPVWVSEQSVKDVGDEAVLLAQFAPTIVSQDRALGAKLADDAGDVIILDDALQNPGLHKDISICVFDAQVGLGNGCVCPSGPLRESLEDALPRIDAALWMGEGSADLRERLAKKAQFSARLVPIPMGIMGGNTKFIAFAGIGRPEKFFESLRAMGVQLIATHEFDDHEFYSHEILERMMREAVDHGARLITTEKDAVRLPDEWKGKIMSLPVRLEMTKGDLGEWVLERLKANQ